MNKLIFSIIGVFLLISCSNVDKKIEYNFKSNNIYIETHPIRENMTEGLNINGELNLVNKEINRYKIRYLNNDKNSKIVMDLQPEVALSDGLIILNTKEPNLLFDFVISGRNKTINKDILFLIMPTDSIKETTVTLYKKIIVDNTEFKINKVVKNDFTYYYLRPIFLDELTFDEKVKQNDNIGLVKPISFNEATTITQYNVEGKNKDKLYDNYISFLEKDRVYFRDKTIPNADIKIFVKDKGIIELKSDDKGIYAAYIPIKKGIIIVQITKNNNIITKKIRVGE